MIIDYCRENKIAISFSTPDERRAINAAFGRYGDRSDFATGVLTHYVEVQKCGECETRSKYQCSDTKRDFRDYTIITADEFFELNNPYKSYLKKLIK